MPLIFVPTPLGNLRDITLRSIDVLREAALVVAEDSRVARRLLSALGICGKAIWTYHEHNAGSTTEQIIERAKNGQVAVVTDAGTPGISDPGSGLVRAAREASLSVEMLPGPCGLVCAAVLSGFDLRRFAFEGFPPRSAGARRRVFQTASQSGITTIWYESPQRIAGTLMDLASVAPLTRVFLLREFTKMHEQQLLGVPAQVLQGLSTPVRGEIMFVIEAQSVAPLEGRGEVESNIDVLLDAHQPVSAIAKQLAEQGFGERRALYSLVMQRKKRWEEAQLKRETPPR
ncbi:MAG: 16S rRNA (cytidine(1402)-2'-O)-methyltransferase [Candidatus Eremiobacteraeota bacterium]|nr:16S rRNA (cytidine(1402)-2'-O)-methyltransferase [Candidatus Eremiobacteraeota bacterium]